jgi:hypothetical protein
LRSSGSASSASSVSALSRPTVGRDVVAVQAAQNSSSRVIRLIHSSRAMGTPNAPYMLLAAMPCK